MSWLELFPGWCVRIYGVREEIFCWNMEYASVISWGMQTNALVKVINIEWVLNLSDLKVEN